MKIRTKILTGYLLLAIPLMAIGLAGYKLTRDIGAAFTTMADKTITDSEIIDDVRFAAMWLISSTIESAWLLDRGEVDSESLNIENRALVEARSLLEKKIAYARIRAGVSNASHELRAITDAATELLEVSNQMIVSSTAGAPTRVIHDIQEKFEGVEMKFLQVVQHALEEQKQEFITHRNRVDSSIRRAFIITIGLDIVLLAAAIFAGRAVAGTISRPILKLREAAEKMAAGKSGIDLRRESEDEVGDLTESFRDMARARDRAEENQERHALALAEQNEELKSFAYVTSHDLREPLVTIRGFSGELKRTLQDVDNSLAALLPHLDDRQSVIIAEAFQYDVPEAFRFIESSIEQMESRIYAIQKLSQLGHLEMVPKPLHTQELVETLLSGMSEEIAAAGASIELETLPEVTADRSAMFQVIGHLVENALKYHSPSRTPRIGISAERSDREIIFHVCDNGRGIAEEDLARIFNMFRTSGADGKQKPGMGLAYVKALVRRMGGRIWCKSTLGEGSVFSFTIPATER